MIDAGEIEALRWEQTFRVDMDRTPGYCLNAMKATLFLNQKYVNGAPFYCPYCGEITERFDAPERAHIFDPPPRLLKVLACLEGTDAQLE